MPSNGAVYLAGRIHDAIDYCRQEWEMSYAETIGVLEIVK